MLRACPAVRLVVGGAGRRMAELAVPASCAVRDVACLAARITELDARPEWNHPAVWRLYV